MKQCLALIVGFTSHIPFFDASEGAAQWRVSLLAAREWPIGGGLGHEIHGKTHGLIWCCEFLYVIQEG